MKAWICYDGDPGDGCLLVYAETRNKARYLATLFDPEFLSEYEHISARRRPDFDQYRDKECLVYSNDELPEGVNFYRNLEQ